MSKPTPGPWLIEGTTVYTLHRLAHAECNRWSAQFAAYVGCPREEAEANARLCASAPDLLEALQGLVDMDVAYQRGPKVEQAVAAARAAIQKATGGGYV